MGVLKATVSLNVIHSIELKDIASLLDGSSCLVRLGIHGYRSGDSSLMNAYRWWTDARFTDVANHGAGRLGDAGSRGSGDNGFGALSMRSSWVPGVLVLWVLVIVVSWLIVGSGLVQ